MFLSLMLYSKQILPLSVLLTSSMAAGMAKALSYTNAVRCLSNNKHCPVPKSSGQQSHDGYNMPEEGNWWHYGAQEDQIWQLEHKECRVDDEKNVAGYTKSLLPSALEHL